MNDHNQWVKTVDMCGVTGLEASSQKSRCPTVLVPTGDADGESLPAFLPHFGGWLPAICGVPGFVRFIIPTSASLFS